MSNKSNNKKTNWIALTALAAISTFVTVTFSSAINHEVESAQTSQALLNKAPIRAAHR